VDCIAKFEGPQRSSGASMRPSGQVSNRTTSGPSSWGRRPVGRITAAWWRS